MSAWVIGNWKMHGDAAFVRDWTRQFTMPPGAPGTPGSRCQVAVCPPFPYLSLMRGLLPDDVILGAQNLAADEADGAYTGEVSARMAADNGCRLALIGHSERRRLQGETDELCRKKTAAAARAGLRPVLCVGESADARRQGRAAAVVTAQLDAALSDAEESVRRQLIIAYEPIWAIGSGQTPSVAEINDIHQAIRTHLLEQAPEFGDIITVLYGGSVNADNAAEIFSAPSVEGFLIGGCALNASDFSDICKHVNTHSD